VGNELFAGGRDQQRRVDLQLDRVDASALGLANMAAILLPA